VGLSGVNSVPQASPYRLIVGTAGHIDHGKTLLIKALTGTDCDRWAEEKARGITIDLGFACLTDERCQIGFIDVPGHHRFVPNALAGIGGVKVALLVVAATEGVMPQTREHVAICTLLGIPSMIVVLTKIDLAEAELVELAELDITELLERTRFAGAPILRVSSVTGQGLAELKAELARRATEGPANANRDGPIRLPVDRAFNLLGVGVVVTGTLLTGVVQVGDTLELLPERRLVRVRGIHVHGETRAEAMSGERTSLQLAGVKLEEVQRGHQLARPGGLHVASTACARLTLIEDAPASLQRCQDVQVFVHSAQVRARIRPLERKILEPGESGLVEVRFLDPVALTTGDRFIVRRSTPAATLGGGEVLDPAWSRRRGVPPHEDLHRVTESRANLFELWAARSGYQGLALTDFVERCGLSARDTLIVLDELARAQRLRRIVSHDGVDGRWISESTFTNLKSRSVELLQTLFRRDRLSRGMARAEFARRLLPRAAPPLVNECLAWLEHDRCIAVHGDLISLPGHVTEPTPAEARAASALEERFRHGGLTPPSVDEVIAQLATEGHDVACVRDTLRYLVGTGTLVRLPSQDLVSVTAVEKLQRALRASGWKRFSVPVFKDAFGLSRRWAIPLLEYCDAVGVTRRDGSDRVVVDPT
jgi:selenocysteine-specific elongation factor